MGIGTLGRLDQFSHDMVGRGLIGITHAEIDNIFPCRASFGFQIGNNIKNVGR